MGENQAANYWKTFTLISEIIATSTLTHQNSNIKIYASHSEIIIEGVISGQMVNIIGIDGKQLVSQVSKGEQIRIEVKTNGIYIVKVADRNFKMIF
jgi:hypothetical protein